MIVVLRLILSIVMRVLNNSTKTLKTECEVFRLNILLFNGGTSNKNTKLVVNIFKSLCESKGHTVFYLDSYYHDCINCRKCASTGECCIKDDITGVFKNNDIDIIIIGTPLYFFYMSAKAKAFLDRLYSINLRDKILGLICVSGSPYYESGTPLVEESIVNSCDYCKSHYGGTFHMVTNDEYTGYLTEEDKEGLNNFLCDLEVTYSEIKEDK